MDDSGPPAPGDGDDSGGTDGYSGSSYIIADYGTNLWIANFALSSNNAAGIVTNTTADVSYEIQYAPDLLATQWFSAGFVLGSELTNWTPMTVTSVSLTNNAFFRIRSWADDGGALPIWSQLQYFGHIGVDPNADPAGDPVERHSEISKWNESEPILHTSRPTRIDGLVQCYQQFGCRSWQPSSGLVTSYTVQKHDWWSGVTTNFNFSTNRKVRGQFA